jgi:predicted RNase H-like HicB family nuclease
MNYNVKLTWDSEASVWVATSDDVPGLVLESNSYDALIEKVKVAIPELIDISGDNKSRTINFISERLEAVA